MPPFDQITLPFHVAGFEEGDSVGCSIGYQPAGFDRRQKGIPVLFEAFGEFVIDPVGIASCQYGDEGYRGRTYKPEKSVSGQCVIHGFL